MAWYNTPTVVSRAKFGSGLPELQKLVKIAVFEDLAPMVKISTNEREICLGKIYQWSTIHAKFGYNRRSG